MTNVVDSFLGTLAECGLTVHQVRIILLVGNGKLTPKSLALSADVSYSQVSRCLQALEVKKYVEREISGDDKRSFCIRLTSKGEKLFDKLNKF